MIEFLVAIPIPVYGFLGGVIVGFVVSLIQWIEMRKRYK